jgi:hypothetical protein
LGKAIKPLLGTGIGGKLMGKAGRTSANVLGVLVGLELSVLWILMGLELGFTFKPTSTLSTIVTLGAHRHTIMTIASLLLIPICARELRWGFLAAMILGIATIALTTVSVIEMVVAPAPGDEGRLFGPIIWIVLQVPVILFSHRGRKEQGEAVSTAETDPPS